MVKPKGVKVQIPVSLQRGIMRIMVEEKLDWDAACDKAAALLDENGEAFKKAVNAEAERRFKSRLMKEVNNAVKGARYSIWKKAYEEGKDWVRMNEDNFRVPCMICGKPMYFSSRDKEWESQIKPILYEAFANWYHTSCSK